MTENRYAKPFVATLCFTILIFGFEAWWLPVEQNFAESSVNIGVYLLASVSLVLFFIFTFFAITSPYIQRLFYLALFVLATITEYGYYNALRHFSTPEDLENIVFGTNLDSKIDAIIIYFNWKGLVPCAVFLLLILTMKPVFENGWRNFAGIMFSCTGFFLVSGYLTSNNYPTISTAAYYRTLIGSPFKLEYFQRSPRKPVNYQSAEAPKNNIVVIIDESINGSHLSINGYPRSTTPFLEELEEKGFVKNWGLAISGTSCSITSNKLLLAGPDMDMHLLDNPIIFQYAKAMGYKTYYFDGQMTNLWSIHDSDLQFLDEHITRENLPTENSYETDGEIARRVKKMTNNSTGNFIWVNKRGTHVPYQNAYPESKKTWSPTLISEASQTLDSQPEEKEPFNNNYDNALKYNLDLFFTSLLNEGPNKNTFYVYTSDHGQNVMDVADQGTHCGDLPDQVVVPLLMVAEKDQLTDVDINFKASHSNIFATLLDLMNFPVVERKHSYDLSLLKAKAADSKPRTYLAGSLSSGSRKIAFDERFAVASK